MARKRIRGLTNLASLGAGGYYIPVDPPTSGDARKVLDTAVRTFMTENVTSDLAAHIAETEAHGISAYVSSILGSADAAATLAALGIVLTGTASNGKLVLSSLFTWTWRDHTLAANTTLAKAYGQDHTYSSWARAWLSGDDFVGADNEISAGITVHGTSTATVRNDGDGSSTFTLFSIGV